MVPPSAGHDFDRLAPWYDRGLGFGLFFAGGEARLRRRLVAGLIKARLAPGARVIEIGCGTGSNLVALDFLRPGLALAGLDLSRPMLAAAARKTFSNPPLLVQGDAARLPFADESLDAALAVFALHEMPADVRRGAAAELRRVLRPGGWCLVADLSSPLRWPGRAIFAFLSLFEDREALEFARLGAGELLAPAGFAAAGGRDIFLGLARVQLFQRV
jgi:ubiquinone/menaquinone biosynthesis C-methylase UbiE